MQPPEKLARTGIRREPGFLYWVTADGDVVRAPRVRGGARPAGPPEVVVAGATGPREDGYVYVVDADGDVVRFARVSDVDDGAARAGRAPAATTTPARRRKRR